jgi:hypothetical protein
MCQKEIYPSEELICIGIKELGDERRAIFLLWLESHSGVKELNADGQVQERLNTWLYSLSPGEAIAEHSLIMAEITWCAKVSIQALRRIASTERLDKWRSRNE